MTDLKTSLLVNRQVPEFIREEYPLFIAFLEAYYEFLEIQQGTQKNDLTNKAKDLRYLSDVDASIDQFEAQFFNSYANFLPRDISVDKEFLIKNVLPLYLSKGSEASFKLLFRMLFNDEVEILNPRNNILRASDGRWTVDSIVRIQTDVRSSYVANGSNTTFILAQESGASDIEVYIDDTLKVETTDFFIRKESRKIIFNTAPAANSVVKVFYNNFDISLLNNRKITGQTSGATALVERGVKRIITDQLNFGLPFELFIDRKSITGTFVSGEWISSDIIGIDGSLITIEADTFSILTNINVVNAGTHYNVGDPVIVSGGGAEVSATAEVSSVSEGFTSRIIVNYGGAGFKVASIINSTNVFPSIVTGTVDVVNTAHFTANTFFVTQDIIDDYKNVVISDADYGFPSPISENVNTRIVDALTPLAVTDIGPISNALILFSNTSTNNAILDSEGSIYQVGTLFYDIKTFNSVGRIDINDGGEDYKVGDEVIFSTNPPGTYGFGAAAAVKTTDLSGTITLIEIQPPRIDGTANVLNNSVNIIGTGTSFDTEFRTGDRIVIASQERFIDTITSPTAATVNVAFTFTDGTTWANNYPVGSFAKGLVGGSSYTQGEFPSLTVSSENGTNADIEITSLMGNGEDLNAISDSIQGQILSIRVKTGGSGYQYLPEIDLSGSGDGNATANSNIGSVFATFPGRWTTSDSILSSSERKLQGENYYIDYSYVTSSLTEFSKYKEILKTLLHPAGYANYADLNIEKNSRVDSPVFSSSVSNTFSGLVSTTNTSIFLTGSGTLFNVANTKGLLTIGSNVAVNGEIRTVNTIISNTNVSVTVAFTSNSSGQSAIVIT